MNTCLDLLLTNHKFKYIFPSVCYSIQKASCVVSSKCYSKWFLSDRDFGQLPITEMELQSNCGAPQTYYFPDELQKRSSNLFFNFHILYFAMEPSCRALQENTGCPKIKLALGKHLEIAIHGFKLCILYVRREKLGPNPSRASHACIPSV